MDNHRRLTRFYYKPLTNVNVAKLSTDGVSAMVVLEKETKRQLQTHL